jgi:hypothetical protein
MAGVAHDLVGIEFRVSVALFLAGLQSLAGSAPVSLTRPDECRKATADEVVVCGRRDGRSPYRLPVLPNRYETQRLRAQTEIAPGVRTSIDVAPVELPEGVMSNRLLLSIKIGL